MKANEVMKKLEAAGSAQTRKTYARHGVAEPMFGVSYAVLGKLTKEIKVDHALALELWKSGNHDACVLATMIADPQALTAKEIAALAKGASSYVITDAIAKLVAHSPLARKYAVKWTASRTENVCAGGWTLVGVLAMSDGELDDAYFEERLREIETNIGAAQNRVRYAMNSALIAIGLRNAKLQKQALAAAGRIGTVDVDHGDTDCKTPDAVAYIKKASARARPVKASKK